MERQIKEYDSLIDLLEDLDRQGIYGRERREIYLHYLLLHARIKGMPYSGGFELTPLCNFDCKMCYVHLSKGQAEQEAKLLSTEQWIDIMNQAIDAGMMHADLTGGECLSYPGFKEIYLHLLSRGVLVSVLTNGSLLSDEMVSFFSTYKPEIIQVSLYGSDNDAYERVTGKRAFDVVLRGIQRLNQCGVRVKVSIMPHRYMKEDRYRLLELVHSLGIEYGIGTATLPARSNTGRDMEDYIAESRIFTDLRIKDERFRVQHGVQGDVLTMPIAHIPKGLCDDGGIPCNSGRCSFHVNWKGELTPCIPYDRTCASVLEHGFHEAWLIVKRLMETYHEPEECRTCEMRKSCMACPAEKTFGVLNGSLNTAVCDRLRSYLNEADMQNNP